MSIVIDDYISDIAQYLQDNYINELLSDDMKYIVDDIGCNINKFNNDVFKNNKSEYVDLYFCYKSILLYFLFSIGVDVKLKWFELDDGTACFTDGDYNKKGVFVFNKKYNLVKSNFNDCNMLELNCGFISNVTLPSHIESFSVSGNKSIKYLNAYDVDWIENFEGLDNEDAVQIVSHCNAEEIILPKNMDEIPYEFFKYCSKLKKLTLPVTIKKISMHCCYECNNLTEINYNGTIEQWNAIKQDEMWWAASTIRKIKCIDGEINIPNFKYIQRK